MKSTLSIGLTFTAVLLFTFVAVIPHHHHSQAVCLLIELCKDDCDKSDAGSLHCDVDDEPIETEDCSLVEAKYIAASTENKDLKSKFFSSQDDFSQLISFLLLFFDRLSVLREAPASTYSYASFSGVYRSVELAREMPLRAPPHFFI